MTVCKDLRRINFAIYNAVFRLDLRCTVWCSILQFLGLSKHLPDPLIPFESCEA
jgi:hypothetical protein